MSKHQCQCSVCGNKVDAEKNMIAEHKDRKGNMCYGSFTPVVAFNPFYVRRSTPLPNQPVQFEMMGMGNFGVPPANVPEPDGGWGDVEEFVDELNN